MSSLFFSLGLEKSERTEQKITMVIHKEKLSFLLFLKIGMGEKNALMFNNLSHSSNRSIARDITRDLRELEMLNDFHVVNIE